MKNKTITLLSLLALSLSTLAFDTSVQAKIYKWTDANGQVHYSAKPPMQKKIKVKPKDIEDQILMSAGKFDPSKVSKNKASEENQEKTEKNEEDGDNKNAKSKPTKQLIDFCKNQRKSLKLLKNNQNVSWEQFGKKTNLSAAQRKSKIKNIKSGISEDCKGI